MGHSAGSAHFIGLKTRPAQRPALDVAARNQGIFEPHLSLMRQQLPRFKPAHLRLLLRQCALADRSMKGAAKLDTWGLLLILPSACAAHGVK